MHENIIRLLMENGAELLYMTNRAAGAAAGRLAGSPPAIHCEVSTNEKIAFELALAGAYASRRTAVLLSTEGLYEALDPVMSSAYTGVAGSLLVVAVQENDEEVTPLGLFSKLPLIVTETEEELERAIRYGYSVSEEFKIPVVVQAVPGGYGKEAGQGPLPSLSRPGKKTSFVKEPGRWAATPKFRFKLHVELNEKIDKIRHNMESYEDNLVIRKGKTGLITDRLSRLEFYDEDASVLRLATVFPLPEGLVRGFIDEMDEVFVVEAYPVIELQIPDRTKVRSGLVSTVRGKPWYEEKIQGFEVIRDRLGPASSINMAHGIKRLDPARKILAVTFEDHFMHSGVAAFVNTLYNDSAYVLLIMTNERDQDIKKALGGCGFTNVFTVSDIEELARYRDAHEAVVLLYRGMI